MRLRVLLVAVGMAHPVALGGQSVWDQAAATVRRLPVDSFPTLPEHAREEMRRLGCRVPQGSEIADPHNVMSGQFASPDQTDWVFLCSEEGVSSIHVLWGGEVGCATPLEAASDRHFLQGLGEGKIGYSRRLMPVGWEKMSRYAAVFGGREVPEMEHQGIEDYFEGKASTILACVNGAWVRLQGMDE